MPSFVAPQWCHLVSGLGIDGWGRGGDWYTSLQTHSLPKGRGKKGVAELGESPGLLNSPSAQLLQTSPWNLAVLCYLPLNPGCQGC